MGHPGNIPPQVAETVECKPREKWEPTVGVIYADAGYSSGDELARALARGAN